MYQNWATSLPKECGWFWGWCSTHSLRVLRGQVMALLRYPAPPSPIWLDDRSKISRALFCFSIMARWNAPSRVTRLLQKSKKDKCMVWRGGNLPSAGCSTRFLPAQVQVAQAVVPPQAFSELLYPSVGHPHPPQVELHQAAIHCQHLRAVHCPLLLRHKELAQISLPPIEFYTWCVFAPDGWRAAGGWYRQSKEPCFSSAWWWAL